MSDKQRRVLWSVLIPPLGIYRVARAMGVSKTKSAMSAGGGGVVLFVILLVALGSTSDTPPAASAETPAPNSVSQAKPTQSSGRSSSELAVIRRRSQGYVDDARLCMAASQLAFQLAGSAGDLQTAYDRVRGARDVCERIRSELLDKDTKGFTDQADTMWGAVDAMKSADNASLAYLDTSQPSKLSDAQQHQADANALFDEGMRQMNARRRELGIRPLKKLKLG